MCPTPRLRRIELLTVCTGNTCRSAMAVAFLRDRLDSRGVQIDSGGFAREGVSSPAELLDAPLSVDDGATSGAR